MTAIEAGRATYSTEPADALQADDAERMLALWGSGLSHHGKPAAKLAWYYRDHPEGTPLVLMLRQAGLAAPIGVAATGMRRMALGPRELKAGAMVDFVVLPGHRTLFPALFLQKAIVKRALEAHDLLFGLPNPKSVAAILRAGYRRVGERVRRVRVLRFAPYLARFLPRWLAAPTGLAADRAFRLAERLRVVMARGFRGAWSDRPDARFDDLWIRARDPDVLTGVRDARFLAWRFADCPLGRHRFFTLESRADGRLAGYAVCETTDHTMQVRDFLVDPSRDGAWRRLWAELSIEARAQGCASLSVELLGSERLHRRLAAAGFVERGEQPVYAVLPAAMQALADAGRWYLTDADDDV